MRWRSWLRHYATSQKVAISIPDGAIGIFYWLNFSDRSVALGSTQPRTEMRTTNISWGIKAAGGGRCIGLTNFTTYMCRFYWNQGVWTSWNPQGLSRPAMGLLSRRSGRQPKTYVKPEAAITVFELLMMDGVLPETCWAIKKHWNNKFYYTVASCWFFLWDLYYDAQIHEHQVHGYCSDLPVSSIAVIHSENLKI